MKLFGRRRRRYQTLDITVTFVILAMLPALPALPHSIHEIANKLRRFNLYREKKRRVLHIMEMRTLSPKPFMPQNNNNKSNLSRHVSIICMRHAHQNIAAQQPQSVPFQTRCDLSFYFSFFRRLIVCCCFEVMTSAINCSHSRQYPF